jgi:hypothetical protein
MIGTINLLAKMTTLTLVFRQLVDREQSYQTVRQQMQNELCVERK